MFMNTEPSQLISLLQKSFAQNSAKAFLIDNANYSYKDFYQKVCRVRALFRNHSCGVGQRVALITHDKYYLSVLYIAALLEGVVSVVLDPDATAPELLVLLAKTSPQIVFIDQKKLEEVNALEGASSDVTVYPINKKGGTKTSFSLVLRKRKDAPQTFPAIIEKLKGVSDPVEVTSSTEGLILFTSGTTSEPKGVVLTHKNLYIQMQTIIEHFSLNENSVIANHLPPHHTDGLNQGPLLAVACQGTWLTGSAASLQDLGELLDKTYKHRATHFITVPPVLTMMNSLPSEFDDSFSSEEFCFIESTAGFLNQELWEGVEKRFSTQVVNCYGLTETVSEVLYCGPTAETRKLGTIGKPLGCQVKIVDEETGELITDINVSGELCISGGIVMNGYFENPEATERVFEGEWFKTGDLAIVDEDGFYSIVGRKSSLIIRGGVNIHPQEVNEALSLHEDVQEAATVGIEDSIYGERVVSCVLTDNNTLDSSVLLSHCTTNLAKEKLPNEIYIVDEIPYGASGKVNLPKLKTLILERESRDLSVLQKDSTIEEKLFLITSKTFLVSRDDLNKESNKENTAGWDSLGFLKLLLAVEKGFAIQIPPKDVLQVSNLGDLIQVVERLKSQQIKEQV